MDQDKISKIPDNPPPYMEEPPAYTIQPQAQALETTRTNVYTNQGIPAVSEQALGPMPTAVICKSCNSQIVTKTKLECTARAHLCVATLFLLGCFPCMFVPYCMGDCNNTGHYCPECHAYIGKFRN